MLLDRLELSHLISTIGAPLYADEITSTLEMVPIAKFCINYKLGDELPKKIEVMTLDPIMGEKVMCLL